MATFITLNPTQKDEIIDALTSTSGSSGVASAISNLDVNGTGVASAISGLDVDNTGIIAQLQLLNTNIELFNKNVDSVIWQQQNILGAKNLLKYPYYYTTPTTLSGVTYTVNNDGTIETSGIATATNSYTLHTRFEGETNDFILKNGKYILSGCANGGSSSTFEMAVLNTYNSAYRYLGRDYGNGVEFTVNGDDFSSEQSNLQVQITVRNGTNMNGIIFKPMIRLATINDDTFTPYTMTNQEITKYINSIQGGV